jgi:hypothetical protein
MGSKSKTVLVQDPNGAVHQMSAPNAMDMTNHVKGWKLVGDLPLDICDACMGTGKFPVGTNEECWHCEGEGLDPTK